MKTKLENVRNLCIKCWAVLPDFDERLCPECKIKEMEILNKKHEKFGQ